MCWFISHMNESCLVWMPSVSCICVMSHMDESCTIYILRHVVYECIANAGILSDLLIYVSHEWVTSRMSEFCLTYMCHVPYGWVMYHIFIETCRIWLWQVQAFSRICWFVFHIKESCLVWMSSVLYEWVMSHVDTSCSIYLLRHVAYECYRCKPFIEFFDVCLIWMSHVSYEWVLSHIFVSFPLWVSHISLRLTETCRI